jgi:cytochrome c biogenesis protein CcmG/thiol:disulfide interchange protein DsbE
MRREVPLEQWVKYGAGLLAFALVALVWHFGAKRSGALIPAAARREMPKLVLEQMDGGTWRMEAHRGQVVLINYWATWCGPCREEMPGLVRLSRELGPEGLAVVGVSLDEGSRGKVQQFVEEFHVPYPVAFPGPMSQIAQGMDGVPTTILVDRNGRVAKVYVGAVREKDFQEDAAVLLGEQQSAAIEEPAALISYRE